MDSEVTVGRAWIPVGKGPRELALVQRRLHAAESLAELFGAAGEAARDWCGFERALILSVEDDRLSADGLGMIRDPSSDALRRQVLAEPILLAPGSAESELIRHNEGGRGGGQAASVLQAALGLEHYALGAVMPEERVLALLVVDRAGLPVEQPERDAVQFFAHLLALAVERLYLRLRMQELSGELRLLTASALAAMKEALESPVALPRDYGSGPVFPSSFPVTDTHNLDRAAELLTPRELQIAKAMIAGRSNREIALELHLSPETVKGYVARVLRKLGATNRVDAVSRFLRLTGANDR